MYLAKNVCANDSEFEFEEYIQIASLEYFFFLDNTTKTKDDMV